MFFTWEHGDFETENRPLAYPLTVHQGIPSLEKCQEVVRGLIVPVNLWYDENGMVSLYVNDNGLYECEYGTFYVPSCDDYPEGWIGFGNFVIVRIDKNGETVPLTYSDTRRLRWGDLWIERRDNGMFVPCLEVLSKERTELFS